MSVVGRHDPRDRLAALQARVSPQAGAALGHALADVSTAGESGFVSDGFLQPLAEAFPLALGVDFANIRLLGPDGCLYLVAAAGCTSTEIRKRALHPLALASVPRMVETGGHVELARSLGIRTSTVLWIGGDGDPLGVLMIGSRTERLPSAEALSLGEETLRRLAERLATYDGWRPRVPRLALALARGYEPKEWPSDLPHVASLRPRERGILELYGDGLSTKDIAELLVISPHTIRTHVKLALRRLQVHSREEAAAIVRADQLAQLL